MDPTQITPQSMQNAINFAKQDPKSSYAQELQKRIQSGSYNTVLQQMGKDTSKYGAPAPAAATAPAADPTAPDTAANPKLDGQGATFSAVGGAIGNDFNTRADAVGKIQQSTDNPVSKTLQIAGQGAGVVNDTIGEVAKSVIKPEVMQAIGAHLAPLVQSAAQSPAGKAVLDWFGGLNPETQRNLGATGSIASLLSNAIGAGAAKEVGTVGVDAAMNVAKDTVAPATEAATTAADTMKQTAKDAVLGTPEGKAAAAAAAQVKNTAAVTDKITQDASTMTPTMKKAAISDPAGNRQVIADGKLGNTDVSYKPTKEVTRAGEILSDPEQVANPIKATDKPNTVYTKTQAAISQKGADAETFLRKNPVEVTPKDETDMLNKMRTEAASNSTPAQMKAYNDQISLFQKQLEKKYVETGTLNTSDYYEALKNYETNVASKFSGGKEALIDPEGIGSANVQAAADLRASVRDLIGSKHPEFKPQMYDLTSLYEARDNALFNASKVKSQSLLDKHPKVKKGLKTAATVSGLGAIGGLGIEHL